MDEDEEFGLRAAFRLLWSYKVLIGVACGGCGLVAVGMALTAVPVYRAEVVVVAIQTGGMGSGTALLTSQLMGLDGLSGLNGLTQTGRESRAAELILESRWLAEEFIKRNDLLPVLSGDAKKPRTLWSAVRQFKQGVLSIRKDGRKGATTLAVEWTDPVTAARWANGFVALANERIRGRVLDESSRNIAYLNRRIAQTSGLEIRQLMYDIIESETKTLMLANGRIEYAFQVVDPAVPPEIRVRPRRTLMVLAGIAVGALGGVTAAFVLSGIGRQPRRDPQGAVELER